MRNCYICNQVFDTWQWDYVSKAWVDINPHQGVCSNCLEEQNQIPVGEIRMGAEIGVLEGQWWAVWTPQGRIYLPAILGEPITQAAIRLKKICHAALKAQVGE